MKTAVVILNWNTRDYLARFLPGLLASVGDMGEVIVADNASTDGSVEMLEAHFPTVRRICLDRNYGFTGGYNAALSQLEGFTYFLLLNSDIEVPSGWLEPLVSYMETHPSCGACGPKLHAWNERDRFEYSGAAGGLLDAWGFPFCRGRVMRRTEKDSGQYDGKDHSVLWVSGACLMVRSRLWKELGGFDGRFFAHMEEIDFCWRLWHSGHTVDVVTESTVYHIGGGTLPAASPMKLKLNYRNNLMLLENNLPVTYAAIYLQKGASPEKAAKKGLRRAGRRIFGRMLIDGFAAAIYLIDGKPSLFNAVVQAHREFKKLRRRPDAARIADLAGKGGGRVKGLYNGSIIAAALLRQDHVFDLIHGL